MRKKVVACTLVAAMAMSLAACGSSSTGGASTTYRTLYSSECNTLNYLVSNNAVDTEVAANVVDGLVEYDQYGNIQPCLAESWESNDDDTVWTFHIRKDVKWVDKDGKDYADVTARDWIASAQYVNDAANESGTQYMYSTGAVVHNAQAYYDYTAYMIASENGTKTTDEDGNELEPVDEVDVNSIGVTAPDDYTLVYTLDQPCSFFLSVLTYASYLPVNAQFLEQCGDQFGLDNDNLLYCGAYILSTYSPQEEHVLTKNESYWDKDNVKIGTLQSTYNAEADSVGASMYKAGDIDAVSITSDLLDSWFNDDSTKDLVHGTRPNNSYSYFYSFNFDPEFDAEYEPDNWKIAVNNENFRLALTSAMDRVKAITVNEPYNPEGVINNTVTPTAFCSAGGKDYTQYDALKSYTDGDSFDADKAVEYRDAARKELEAAGCTFPVKVLMPYNPSTTNWDKECQVLEQQMEGVLGSDFIDIIVEAGPETGFLSSVRRSGCYAFMKCNWGADYADPETWTEPFTADNNYGFWDLSEDENTSALYKEYQAKVDEASAIYDDDEARYTAFSEAEAILIENAIIVPFSISSNGYEVSKLNSLEGEYAPYGMTLMKYKFMSVHDTSMSMDDWNTALDTWKSEREKAIAK